MTNRPVEGHSIRLRGPWKVCPGKRFDEERAIRVKLPLAGGGAIPPASRYLFRRSFNTPSGLTAAEQLWLVIDRPDSLVKVEVNSRSLLLPSRLDGTPWLQWPLEVASVDADIQAGAMLVPYGQSGQNRLDLTVALPSPAPPTMTSEIRLVVHRSAR